MEDITITQEQLENTVNKAVENAKLEFAKTLNPFAGQPEVKKEANPAILGSYVKTLANAKRTNKSVQEVATDMATKSGSYASSVVAKAVMGSGTSNDGEEFVVPTLSNEFIDLLYNANVVRQSGPMMLTMSGAELRIPYGSTGATAIWEDELVTTGTKSNLKFNKFTLKPKRLMAWTTISNDLLNDVSVRTDMIVQDMIMKALGNKEELGIFEGAGTGNEPKGIYNWIASGNKIQTTGTTAEQIETDLLNALSKTVGQNSNGKYKWFMRPGTLYALMSKKAATTGAIMFPELRNPVPTLFGYEVVITNNIPVASSKSKIYLVNLDELVIADRTPMTVKINPYQNDSNFAVGINETLVYVESRVDVLLKHDVGAAAIYDITYI